jgi:hypothetical protein
VRGYGPSSFPNEGEYQHCKQHFLISQLFSIITD